MRHLTRGRLGGLLMAGGVALVAVGRVGGELTGRSSAELGWKQWAVLCSGAGLTLAGVAAAPLTRRRLFPARAGAPKWASLVLIAGSVLLLLWALLVALDQSLWHDEAYSILNYTSGGPRDILFGDYVPNDHVLFNLLAWATTGVVGESEVAYRFWSVLPAIAAVVALSWWSWNRLGRWPTVAVALLAATAPLMLTLARDARGYGLAFLAGALMLIFADGLAREQGTRRLFGFGAAGFIGVATLPVFSIAFVAQALPLMWLPRTRTRVVATVGGVGALLLLLYAPLLGDILDATSQQFGRRLSWHGPLSTAASDLLGPNVQFVSSSDLPPELPDGTVAGDNAIAGAVAAIGALLLWRTGERMLTALLVVPPLFTYLVLTVGDFFVEPRFAAFLLFHMIVLAACGIVGFIRLIPIRWARGAATAAAGIAAACATVHAVQASDAIHDLPRENFQEAAEVARAPRGSLVLTDSTRPQGLQYYLGEDNVVQLPPADLERKFCSAAAPTVYVEHPFRGSPLEAPPPALRCLRQRGAEMIRVRQRERGKRIDVWTLTEGR
jgi:hypothetical protein